MDDQRDFLVFVSYSRSDAAMKKSVESTIRDLTNVSVWVDSKAIVPGDAIHANIEKGLTKSDCVLAILTKNSIKSFEVREELIRAHERKIPILVLKESKVTQGSLPHFLRDIAFIEYNQRDLERSLREVRERIMVMANEAISTKLATASKDLMERCKIEVPEEWSTSIVSAQQLRASDQRMSGEVFAIELLTQPVTLERDETGSVTVKIDRREVKEMLISNEAKLATTERYVTHKKKKELRELDRKVQAFLAVGRAKDAGGPPDTMAIDLPKLGICLRWASGGVLSIVTDTEGKQWVPLFFRDIRPYGWNIALGTTERWFDKTTGLVDLNYSLEADLNSPRSFIFREFLEESIVVNGDSRTNGTLVHKQFHFLNTECPVSEERAKEFYDKHSALRKDEGDGLRIREETNSTTGVTLENTRCSLKVRSDSRHLVTKNLLICFSLLDLGIEVVRVARYNLEDGDWMLDGEIREKHVAETGRTQMELIRMPVAILSLEYLRKTFGPGNKWHCYTFGPQPSIKVSRAPIPEREIKLFPWDIERRMKAVEGEWGKKWHRDRFVDWYDKFGSHFFKDRKSPEDEWQLSNANPSRLFVPGTAKILNLYFSLLDGKEKND